MVERLLACIEDVTLTGVAEGNWTLIVAIITAGTLSSFLAVLVLLLYATRRSTVKQHVFNM